MSVATWPKMLCRRAERCLHCRRDIKPGEFMVDERDTLGGWLCLRCSDET